MSAKVPRMRNVQFAELIEFVAVAECRSFTRAAAQLGVSTSTLSQAIKGAEERVGLRLLNRTTRQVAPTPAGERLLERLRPVFKNLESALEELNAYRDTPAGSLRLAIAPAAAQVVGPILGRFVKQHPDIRIEIAAADALADLAAGYDAGIQLDSHVADDMVAVRVSQESQHAIVGAPSYFATHAMPQSPRELPEHNCICLKVPSGKIVPWRFSRGDDEFSVPVDGTIVLNDMELALHAAVSGGGLLYVPESRARAALAEGALQGVLQAWIPRPSRTFVLYYPSRRQNPAALQCLADFLRKNLKRERLGASPSPQLGFLHA